MGETPPSKCLECGEPAIAPGRSICAKCLWFDLGEGEELCIVCEQLPQLGKNGKHGVEYHVCRYDIFPKPHGFEKACMHCLGRDLTEMHEAVCKACLPKALKDNRKSQAEWKKRDDEQG